VRDFGSVVGVACGVVHDGRHDAAMGGPVAAEAIGDDAARHSAAAPQQCAKEPRRGVAIPAGLEQDVDDVPVLIHCTPQIVAPAVDGYEQLVEMPMYRQRARGDDGAAARRRGRRFGTSAARFRTRR
jgi:hypothetical protein